MNYCVVRGKTKYIALAKKEPFTCEHPDPIIEPGELWFEFGDTPEQALARLKESLTPLALDGGDSAALQAVSAPEVLSPSLSDSASRPAAQ